MDWHPLFLLGVMVVLEWAAPGQLTILMPTPVREGDPDRFLKMVGFLPPVRLSILVAMGAVSWTTRSSGFGSLGNFAVMALLIAWAVHMVWSAWNARQALLQDADQPPSTPTENKP